MTSAAIAFFVLFTLLFLGAPIAFGLLFVGFAGFAFMQGLPAALAMVGQVAFTTVLNEELSVIPLFVLMGGFIAVSRLSDDLFNAANAFIGHLRGGLAMSTVVACAGFAAVCGSSFATAATMSKVALPPMRRFGYSDRLAAGAIASGATLGIMIPPSVPLLMYGFMTRTDVGKLFIAGVIPGLVQVGAFMLTIAVIVWLRPNFLPASPRLLWSQRLGPLRDVWAPVVLFLFVIGGLYGGLFTATEAGGMGAAGAFIIGVVRRRLPMEAIKRSLLEATRTSAAVFTILIGALIFGYFLTITQTPQKVTALLTGLGIGSLGVLIIILLMYLILGCLMDAMAMVILTVPIVFPVIIQLGFDPIWFGVIIVMTVELGLIHPPVGMNVFVIKSMVKDVDFTTIFMGVLPFVGALIIVLALMVAFPQLATWLPSRM